MEPWPSFSLMLRTHTLALKAASFTLHLSHFSSRPQLRLCTALLLPALPKVHSDAESGPLNLPQSLVIMLSMLNDTLHSTLYLYTLHPALYTFDSKLYTRHSTHYTLHLTLRFTLYTWHLTLHSTRHTRHNFTLDTLHYILHSTLCTTLHTLHLTPRILHFTLYTLHFTLCTVRSTHYTLHFTLSPCTLTTLHFSHFTLYGQSLGLALFSCCARAPTSRPQLRLCTVLLLPALPKAHSDSEGGPLNLPQSLVITLALLNFLVLFVQQYIIIICSHPRPLRHTSPQDV